ncbi:MAG: RNA polymerase sigma factor [Patescibacteria group bacterium]|nr:RNA polymerase sigma factor [Patescibacteria group bacterium]
MKELENLEEKLILKRVLNGEKEAFAEIYDFYVIRIFRFVYLKTSSKETAEDLTSDAFLRCWKYIKEKSESGKKEIIKNNKIGSFLYRIARNLIIDHYRKKKHKTVEISEEEKESIVDQKQDILAEIDKKQEIEELRKALGHLNDDYQEILILRYVEDLSMAEIAEITEKKEGAIRVQLHRAVKALEKVMRNDI